MDTEGNRQNVEAGEDYSSDKAIVKELGKDAKTYTFRNLLGYMVTDADGNERPIAEEVKEYVEQHNGNSTLCEIRACDTNGDYIPSSKESTILDLDEPIEPYVSRRNIDGENFDCIEMIVGQITSVGGK